MAAPIQRWSDPRLYGTAFVRPFDRSYQGIRAVSNPIHPECHVIAEIAFRAMKMITGILAIAITVLPALVGRLVQIIHFYALSANDRAHQAKVSVHGMDLPVLVACPMPASIRFHGTNSKGAIEMIRWGFNANRNATGSQKTAAVNVFASDKVSPYYGNNQVALSLDLREGESASLSNDALHEFTRKTGRNVTNKKDMAAVRQLYYQNGYRAIKYESDLIGGEETWSICDGSCISIKNIQQITPGKERFFQTDNHLASVLKFFACRDLARTASTSRAFRSDFVKAARVEIRSKTMLSVSELEHFAKLKSHGKDGRNFAGVSADLANVTELDFSHFNFANHPLPQLHTLSQERREQITSLNFTSSQGLTTAKLKLLLAPISFANDDPLNPIFLFPHLSFMDFTGINYIFNYPDLLHACPFLKNGRGQLATYDGIKWDGDWVDGVPHGQAEVLFGPDGIKYSGRVEAGIRAGHGEMTYSTGEKYDGEWQAGFRSGHGEMTYSNGDKYDGEWQADVRHGQGEYTNSDGEKRYGEWQNGILSHGKMTWLDGSRYNGDWVDGSLTGFGELTYLDEAKYVGKLLNGLPHGQGKLTSPDKGEFFGKWIDGLLIYGTAIFPDGDRYEGEWSSEMIDGEKALMYAHGHGKMTHPNGDEYVGQFSKAKKSGQGTQTSLDGTKREGQWLNDEFIGPSE